MSLKDETPTPHNALFLRAFGSVENAASHLQATLPEEISRHLDWSSLQVRPGSYIDEQLRDLASDLLFELRTKQGDRLQIYVLVEHQSAPDPLMPFRLLRYLVRIWTDWIKEQSSKDKEERQPVTRLPPILPVVLYHGEEGWTVVREFSEMVEIPELLRPGLEPYTPRLSYLLQDYSKAADPELQGRALVRLALFLFLFARKRRFWERFQGMLDTLSEVMEEEADGLEALRAVLRYILLVVEEKPDAEMLREIAARAHPKFKETVMTWADQLIQEGEDKALAHQRERVEDLFRMKFGALSPDVVGRIQAGSREELDRWTAGLLFASSIEDAFTFNLALSSR